MPIEIIYLCWGCGAKKIEVEPSEDQTRSEMIIWNLCPSCITTEKKMTNDPTALRSPSKSDLPPLHFT